MPYCTKLPLLKKFTKCCGKNLEMIENTFFMYFNKKN